MIIGNNGSNFGNQNNFRSSNNNNQMPSMPNSFENRFNKVQEYNRERQPMGNGFVKNIQDQKYASSSDTLGMQDRTLAMLNDRLAKGTISLDEFNRKCAQLGKQREMMSKKNKLF
jgi:hypothetical protein